MQRNVLIVCFLLFIGFSKQAYSEDIRVGNTTRNMLVYAPSGLGENPPLVISLHGMNQDAPYQKNSAKFEPVADREKFVVVFPNGIDKAWDISGSRDIDFILAIIDEMADRYSIDRNRVYVSGFSMGGMMSYHVANTIADKIAAIGPVSGYLFNNSANSSRPMPIIHVHGDADDVVNYDGVSSTLQAWREHNGCPSTAETISPYPSDKPGSVATRQYWGPCDNSEIVLITLAGKGHWYSMDENSVNTSEEIWAFFKKFSLNSSTGPTIPAPRDSIYNGDFVEGADGWSLNVWAGNASGSVVDETYQVSIETIGTDNYQIQLIQSGLIFENGKSYELTFDAHATSERPLEVNVEMDVDPWTSYLQEEKQFNLTTAPQTCTVQFTMEEPTDSSGRVSFNAGASTADVFIDNISLHTHTVSAMSARRSAHTASGVTCRNSMLYVASAISGGAGNTLCLYDLKGNLVHKQGFRTSTENSSHRFDLSNISKGAYLITIKNRGRVLHSSEIMLWK